MSVELIGILTIAAGLICLRLGYQAVVIVFVSTALFGSAAALFIGANNIQPAHLFLGFVAVTMLARRRETAAALTAIQPPQPGFWFACLVLYGIITAIVLPRLLEGQTLIVPLGVSAYGDTNTPVPLSPVSSNFTQAVYVSADLLCFVIVAAIASTREGLETMATALLAYAGGNVLFALLDLATYSTGTQSVLEFMRNARYTLHNEEEVSGLKRIVGSFTETSSFARSTLGVLGFTATMWLCGRRPAISGILALCSVVLLIFSTSSTGMVGLVVALGLLYATALYIALFQAKPTGAFVVVVTPLLAGIAILALMLNAPVWAAIYDYVDTVVLNKLNTSSGIERSLWNTLALQNFFDTWGLGVGLGTNRTSNFFLALLSNTGALGVLFYFLFAYGAFFRGRTVPRSFPSDLRIATRNGCLCLLAGDMLVSPVIDQGLLFYVLAGVAAGTAQPFERRAPRREFTIADEADRPVLARGAIGPQPET